jgi:hypothetical protein
LCATDAGTASVGDVTNASVTHAECPMALFEGVGYLKLGVPTIND